MELFARFMKLFPNRGESGVKRPQDTAWRNMSKYYCLSDEEIRQAIEGEGNLLRAFSIEASSDFLVVSLSSKSAYKNAPFISNVRSALRTRGIATCLYELQECWYLYVFFTEKVDTSIYAETLKQWCESLGMKTGEDGVHVQFPQSLVPFPLQPGFHWLNDRCQKLVRRDELSFEKALAFLLTESSQRVNVPEAFLNSFQAKTLSSRLAKPVAAKQQELVVNADLQADSTTSGNSTSTSTAASSSESEFSDFYSQSDDMTAKADEAESAVVAAPKLSLVPPLAS